MPLPTTFQSLTSAVFSTNGVLFAKLGELLYSNSVGNLPPNADAVTVSYSSSKRGRSFQVRRNLVKTSQSTTTADEMLQISMNVSYQPGAGLSEVQIRSAITEYLSFVHGNLTLLMNQER